MIRFDEDWRTQTPRSRATRGTEQLLSAALVGARLLAWLPQRETGAVSPVSGPNSGGWPIRFTAVSRGMSLSTFRSGRELAVWSKPVLLLTIATPTGPGWWLARGERPHEPNARLAGPVTDAVLPDPNLKEALSHVLAQAVAARAGYTTAFYDFDLDGIDLRIQGGGSMRPAIELQLKATINLSDPQDGFIRYPLRRRNYDLLIVDAQTPRLLMVLDLPSDERDWMTIDRESLILR